MCEKPGINLDIFSTILIKILLTEIKTAKFIFT